MGKNRKFLLQFLIVTVTLLEHSYGTPCGSTSNTYCLNDRQYITCQPLIPGSLIEIFTCPTSDYFCADITGTCTSDRTIPRTNNTQCGQCSINQGRGHTCTSLTTFRRCFDGVADQGNSQQCPTGQYCSALSPYSVNPCTEFTGREILCWQNFEQDLPGPVESTSALPSVTTDDGSPSRPSTMPPIMSEDEQRCAELGVGHFDVDDDHTCRT